MFINSYKFVTSKITNRATLILLLIILVGAFLRLYNFDDLLRFNADQVRDAKIVDTIQAGETFPLFGPKAGGTKFNLGGAFYYLEYLSGAIFGFSPAGIAFFIPLLSIASIYLFYVLFKKIFPINITLGLTFLYAISFYAIKYSHFAWNPNVIPFFVLAFLLLLSRLLEGKNKFSDFIWLGIVIGLASQLHTTLLILMPVMTLLTLTYIYFKKINFSLRNVSLLIIFFLLMNAPFIFGNFLDHGANLKDFLAGTTTKTGGILSLTKNTTEDIKFFLQGSSYYLTGIEPQKNWFNFIKLIKSQNLNEISLLTSSLILFLSGLYLLFIQKIKNNSNIATYQTTLILSSFSLLAFLFFILIGNELNLRFFIILSFLPYLLLGAIAQYLSDKINSPKVLLALFSLILFILTFLNLNMFVKTYNLNNYRAPESAYGGISLGELSSLCNQMKEDLRQASPDLDTAQLESFEFKRSLEYVCLKNHKLKVNSFSQKDVPTGQVFFVITENKNAAKNIEIYQQSTNQITAIQIKRFTLLTVWPIQ